MAVPVTYQEYYILEFTGSGSPSFLEIVIRDLASYGGSGSEFGGNGASDDDKLAAIGNAIASAINGLSTDWDPITFSSVNATRTSSPYTSIYP